MEIMVLVFLCCVSVLIVVRVNINILVISNMNFINVRLSIFVDVCWSDDFVLFGCLFLVGWCIIFLV